MIRFVAAAAAIVLPKRFEPKRLTQKRSKDSIEPAEGI